MQETLIVCVMNRKNRVREALANWFESPSVSKVILVDWNSKEQLTRELIPNENVWVVRVEGEPYWNLARAYNLAASFVTEDVICKMDADYRMTPDLLSEEVKKGEFWRGDTRKPKEINEVYINGFVRFWRKDFLEVNGYNERINGYGMDDTDLYNRFEQKGLKVKWIPYGNVTHYPHPDTDRTSNLQPNGLNIHQAICKNKELIAVNPWKVTDKKAIYDIMEVGKNYFVAKSIK